jgi:hypothetical protein
MVLRPKLPPVLGNPREHATPRIGHGHLAAPTDSRLTNALRIIGSRRVDREIGKAA